MASVIGELAQSEKEELSGIVRFMAAEGGLVGRLADCATRFPRHPAVQAAVFMALDELIRVLQLDGVMQEAQAYGATDRRLAAAPARCLRMGSLLLQSLCFELVLLRRIQRPFHSRRKLNGHSRTHTTAAFHLALAP